MIQYGKNSVTFIAFLEADEVVIQWLHRQKAYCALGGFETQCSHDVNIQTTFLGTGTSLQIQACNGSEITQVLDEGNMFRRAQTHLYSGQNNSQAERDGGGLVFVGNTGSCLYSLRQVRLYLSSPYFCLSNILTHTSMQIDG